MNNSGGDQQLPRHGQELSSQQRNPPVALSRSVLRSDESSIPSLLYLGRLLSAGGGGSPEYMASVRTNLLQEWKPSGSVKFWRAMDGAFLIQFYDRADLASVLDGAPWCCGGDDLFVLQRAKPDEYLVDQVRLFKAELWVKFYINQVPVEYLSEASIYALAAYIGEPVKCPDTAASPVQPFFRARIRVDVTRPLVASVEVTLEDGECKSISVEYERIGSIICGTCRILGHSADRCSSSTPNPLPRRDRPPTFTRDRSRLSRTSTGHRDDDGGSVGSSSSARNGASPPPLPPTERGSAPSRRGLRFYLLRYLASVSSRRRNPAGGQMIRTSADNMEADAQSSQQQVTSSPQQHTSQEALVMEAAGSSQGITASSNVQIQLRTPQIMTTTMESLPQNGLMASHDGNRGVVIRTVGTQNDVNMGPVDQVVALRQREANTNTSSVDRYDGMAHLMVQHNCTTPQNEGR